MCVVALAIDAHADWPLVLIGNRDEFHARPSAPLARWGKDNARDDRGGSDDAPDGHVIAGRDLESGGSWLGVSDHGRLAVVTNIRSDDPPSPDKASRGDLVADFLKGAGKYAELNPADGANFNPFHLLTLENGGAGWHMHARHISNRPAPQERMLSPGVYALANEANGAACDRRERLRGQLQAWLNAGEKDLAEIFGILRDDGGHRMLWGEDGRPMKFDVPGYPPNFLLGDVYGTRCSSIVTVDREGRGQIIERRFAADGSGAGENRIEFEWL